MNRNEKPGNATSNIGNVIRSVPAKVRKTTKPRSSGRNGISSGRSGGSSSSSGSSHRSSGGGSSNHSSAPRRTPTPAPRPVAPKPIVPPSINSYLAGDSVYQQAVSGGKRTLADYISELARRKGEATTQYNQTLGNMERDRTQQLEDLKNEFASRGLIQSGLYGEQQGKFQQQYTDQLNSLGQQQTGLLNDLLSQQKNYQRENDLAMEQARQEALARRAAKYKIGV